MLDRALEHQVPVRDVWVERFWPSGGQGFRFEWSFRTTGRRRFTLYGQVGAHDFSADCSRGRFTPGGLRGMRIHLPDENLLLHTPDCDAKMPHIAACLSGDTISAGMRNWRGRSADAAGMLDARLLGYKPGRRAAFRFRLKSDGATVATRMGKTFRDPRGIRLLETHRLLNSQFAAASAGRWRVPEPLDFVPELKLAVFSWATGQGVQPRRRLSVARHCAAIEVLSGLHAATIPELATFSRTDELRVSSRWLTALERIDAQRAGPGLRLLERLAVLAEQLAPARHRTIHRDFYEKQLIWDGRTTTLLDLDTLASGEAALDLGNYLAHLYLHDAQSAPAEAGSSEHRLFEVFATLLAHYERTGGAVDRAAVLFYCASSLVRGGALHALRTVTQPHAPGMWELAGRMLSGKSRFEVIGADKRAPGDNA